MRPTFASLLATRNVPATRIRDYLGHASIATTVRGSIEPMDVARLAFGFDANINDCKAC